MMSSLSINILQITSHIGHQYSPNHLARISGIAKPQPSPVVIAAQFLAAMLVLDTWQCFMQTYMHANKSVYKHVQSKHHTLVVPTPSARGTTIHWRICYSTPLAARSPSSSPA
ncbi:unnamed protein product [Musa acuminata var. zebrina]